MADWYYQHSDRILGPVTRMELDFLLSSGRIDGSTLVRPGTTGRWRPLSPTAGLSGPTQRPAQTTSQHQTDQPTTRLPSEAAAETAAADELPRLPAAVHDQTDQVRTRRQVAIGAATAIIVLLLILQFWNSLQSPTAGSGTTGVDASGGSQPGKTGAASTEDATVSDSSQTNGSSSVTSLTDSALPGPSSAPAADPAQQQQTTASAAAATDQTPGPLNQSGSDRPETLVAGDPLSKYTISAPGEASFFGLTATGRRFVFVVDCSSSMTGQGILRARDELMTCITALPPHVETVVVFFNDAARAESSGYQKGHHRRVAQLQKWVDRITAEGGTNVAAGLEVAFKLRPAPDAIFLLTDGAVSSDAPAFIKSRNSDQAIRINTIALVSSAGERLLRQIADENRGDYRFVP